MLVLLVAAAMPAAAEVVELTTPAPPPPETGPVDETGLSEDGQPYLLSGSGARTGWTLGKIEPALERAALEADSLEVILFFHASPTPERPAGIQARHRAAIRPLADEVRTIERSYRPDQPIDEAQEKLLAMFQDVYVSDEDKQRRRQLNEEVDRRLSAMRREVHGLLKQGTRTPGLEMVRWVEEHGGTVHGTVLSTPAIEATLPSASLHAVANHPRVKQVILRPQLQDGLDNSVSSARFDTWHNDANVYDGGAWDGGVIDSGLQSNHPALTPLDVHTDGNPVSIQVDAIGHGTHVAGIMGSNDATFLGTAYGMDKLFYAHRDNGYSAFDGLMNSPTTSDTPEVINFSQSQGCCANDVDYSSSDSFYDVFIQNFDTLVVQAAGNSGWGTTTLDHPASAYNNLVVANMNDRGTTDRSDDFRAGSSSMGPTLGGRLKPDISAPGTNIRSTHAFWYHPTDPAPSCGGTRTADNDFSNCTGTSMAAPHVAGAILLMEDGGNHSPMAQKAVLINTADWWTSAGTQGTGDDGPVTTTSGLGSNDWDPSYGWGYLDMWEAHWNRGDYFEDQLVPRNNNANEDDYKLYAGRMSANERATLVWEKRGIYFGANEPATTWDLSDLNMRLYDETDGSLDDLDTGNQDNVHQVAATSAIDAVVKVYAWSTAFPGSPVEEFALATEEFFTEVPFPDSFGAFIDRPSTVQPNETFEVSFWVANQSEIASHSNTFTLSLPSGWSLVSGSLSQNVGSAAAGEDSAAATWTVRSQSGAQNGVPLQVQHSHFSYGESYLNTHNPTINVVVDQTAPTPNPMSWGTEPYELNASQIRMVATTSSDAHGPTEYYHDFTGSSSGGTGGSDSGWTTSTTYTDSGLQANHLYCYRVRTRDNPTTSPNVTGYSPTSCEYTDIETPSGILFGPIGNTRIEARSLNTPSNLTFGSSGLRVLNVTRGTNSGWKQNNNLWVSTGLSPNTAYFFRAQARNADGSTTAYSPTIVRYTWANLPAPGSLVMLNETTLRATWSANGNPAGTEYLVENITQGTSSGWITNTFWDSAGLTCGGTYEFRLRARNGDGVLTAMVGLGPQTVGVDADGDGAPDCVDLDDDGDGTPDTADCSTLDPAVWSVPSEADSLRLAHATGVTSLSWQAPATPGTIEALAYDTLVSEAAQWGSPGDICVETAGSDLGATHGVNPARRQVFHFLVRATNRCGAGDGGAGSDGGTPIPRALPTCP